MAKRDAIDMRAQRCSRSVGATVSQVDVLHHYVFAWPAFATSECNCNFRTGNSPDISVRDVADLQKRGLSTTTDRFHNFI
jgi:hypothetical protein